MMDSIFYDLLDNRVIVYLDDILIYTIDEQQHVLLVQEVLSRLDKVGLGVNLKKSSFHIKKVKFLSYIISRYSIEMSGAKVDEVRNWEIPLKVKDVQEFLGFANFYRGFIRDFVKLAVALITVTEKINRGHGPPPVTRPLMHLSKHSHPHLSLHISIHSYNLSLKWIHVIMQLVQYTHRYRNR